VGYVIDIDSDLETDVDGRPLGDEELVYTDGTKLSDLVLGEEPNNLKLSDRARALGESIGVSVSAWRSRRR
jgi:hypothetical protein